MESSAISALFTGDACLRTLQTVASLPFDTSGPTTAVGTAVMQHSYRRGPRKATPFAVPLLRKKTPSGIRITSSCNGSATKALPCSARTATGPCRQAGWCYEHRQLGARTGRLHLRVTEDHRRGGQDDPSVISSHRRRHARRRRRAGRYLRPCARELDGAVAPPSEAVGEVPSRAATARPAPSALAMTGTLDNRAAPGNDAGLPRRDTSVSPPTASAAHFTWIPCFGEMAEKLVAFRHQQGLIDLLEGLQAKGSRSPRSATGRCGQPFLMERRSIRSPSSGSSNRRDHLPDKRIRRGSSSSSA